MLNPTTLRGLSPALLVLANLLPVVGVVWWDWSVGSIIIFYWSENLIIGFYNVLRLLSKGPGKAWAMALFFLVHYGGFCAGHGFFVTELFEFGAPPPLDTEQVVWSGPLSLLNTLAEPVNYVLSVAPSYWLWGFLALFISHGISHISNWWLQGERNRITVNELMSEPYARIMILHIVIILGGLAVQMLGSPLALLVVLVIVKTGVDLRAHLRAHRNKPVTDNPATRETGTETGAD